MPTIIHLHDFLLFGTAFVAGGLNAVAGVGSFITFPALIFTGIPPIAANATNTTAMWVASLASVGAYRRDFAVERRVLVILTLAILVGGILGSIALLYIPPDITTLFCSNMNIKSSRKTSSYGYKKCRES